MENKTIIFPFVGDRVGGSHLAALDLVRKIDRSRFKPVWLVHKYGPVAKLAESEGIEPTHLPLNCFVGHGSYSSHIANFAKSFNVISPYLAQFKEVIVHTNDLRMHLSWLFPCLWQGKPQLWHQRTLFPQSRLAKYCARRAAQVVTISQFASNSFADTGITPKIVNEPVSIERVEEAGLVKSRIFEEFALPPETAICGFFANLIEIKQPLLFAEMAAIASLRFARPLVFMVFGQDRDGWKTRMEQVFRSKGGRGRLLFAGFRHPVGDLMAACDAVVATSRGDAFGRTLVEAGLVGTPVLATDAGAHSEIIKNGRTGYLVVDGDPTALAKKLIDVLDGGQEVERNVRGAKDEFELRFNALDHARNIEHLYSLLLKKN